MNTHKGRGLGFRVAAAFAFALAAGLFASSQASAQDPTISIGRATLAVGSGVTLDLNALDIDDPGLGAWIIDISYDPDLVTAIACDSHPAGLCNADFTESAVRTIGATAGGLEGDLTLVSITFQCLDVGTTALAVNATEVADATIGDPQDIDVEVEHGSVGCVSSAPPPPPSELGDVNCDGRVNSVDAALILQYDARRISSLDCPQNADMNDDGRINSVDAAIILQIEAGILNY